MDTDAVPGVDRAHHGGTTDSDVLDFSANVNPETPPGVESAYRDAFAAARRYPDDDYGAFRTAAGDVVDCPADAVVPTAGGLAALRLAVATTVDPGDSVLVPSPGFSEYAREIRLQGGRPSFAGQDRTAGAMQASTGDAAERAGSTDAGTSTDKAGTPADDAAERATSEDAETPIIDAPVETLAGAAAVVVCTPNNPTGSLPEREELLDLAARCREADTTLLVDEAFLGFTDQRSLAGIDGTIVLRSLTKLYGLPGLRAGYAVATGDHRDALSTARQAWSLGTPAAAVGERALGASSFVRRTKRRTRSERERMAESLSQRYEVSPSEAPFFLLALDDGEAVDDLLDRCRRAGIAIRDARTFRGLDRHVRVAVRCPEENDQLLDVLLDGRLQRRDEA